MGMLMGKDLLRLKSPQLTVQTMLYETESVRLDAGKWMESSRQEK